jgi:hypothetical protein
VKLPSPADVLDELRGIPADVMAEAARLAQLSAIKARTERLVEAYMARWSERSVTTAQARQLEYRARMRIRRRDAWEPTGATKSPFNRERRRKRNRAASRSAARNRA